MSELLLIGKTIKEKRLSLNLRMDDVANRAGITRMTLWAIERGKSGYSAHSLFKVMNVLGLSFNIENNGLNDSKRNRATRINTVLDKKINRFIVMCIEQYALSVNERSDVVYQIMYDKGIIDELTNDYEDLHGMSFTYLNDYIKSLLLGETL